MGRPRATPPIFFEAVEEQGLRTATDPEILTRAGDADAAVILCGHTHLPRVYRLADGRLIVNPGSVGLQADGDERPYPHIVEAGSPSTRCAIVEQLQGSWTAELIAVEYDWEHAAQHAEARGRSDWARAVRAGRV